RSPAVVLRARARGGVSGSLMNVVVERATPHDADAVRHLLTENGLPGWRALPLRWRRGCGRADRSAAERRLDAGHGDRCRALAVRANQDAGDVIQAGRQITELKNR